MIKSIANSATRQFTESGKSKFSGLDAGKAKMRLVMLQMPGRLMIWLL
ncbi:hypothetical protein [Rhizobium sp. Root483D2]|nr:hypothetical protein [Rhizobium sp. Root483D2]